MSSSVIYTNVQEKYIQVRVKAEADNPEDGSNGKQTTNTFHFSFSVDGKTPLTPLLPDTYKGIKFILFSHKLDAIRYIEGRRRFLEYKKAISNFDYDEFKQVSTMCKNDVYSHIFYNTDG